MNRIILVLLILAGVQSYGQDTIVPVWNDVIPLNTGVIGEEIITPNNRIRNVQVPELLVYKADSAKNTGMAIVFFPGGGYYHLNIVGMESEVDKYNRAGITVIIVKYRTPVAENISNSAYVPYADALGAFNMVHSLANELQIDITKIGVMGESAGGHLAASLVLHAPSDMPQIKGIPKNKPAIAFWILCSPVVSMQDTITHGGTRNCLLGQHPSDTMKDYFSNELLVQNGLPPALIFHSADDHVAPVMPTIELYKNLLLYQNSGEMHVLAKGGHSIAINKLEYIIDWSKRIGLIELNGD